MRVRRAVKYRLQLPFFALSDIPAGSHKFIVWDFPGPTAKHKSLLIERDGGG